MIDIQNKPDSAQNYIPDITDSETLKDDIYDALSTVIDPELGLDIVNLGMVYNVEVDSNSYAKLDVTLTTPTCPLTDMIEQQIGTKLTGIVSGYELKWVWDPAWTTDMITPEGKDQLRAIGINL
ncbi:MAG: metal-sulfur cluster assembly factor [Bifidobacteriaceae bacterium]|jgi:metal-sulfur cluster biosynthetic enzyme|nr:metal-sulfur cluster assembly factor [Bifidobacteriaceae bacterium]